MVAKRSSGFGRATCVGVFNIFKVRHKSHASPATTGDCLDQHALVFREGFEESDGRLETDCMVAASQDRYAAIFGYIPRTDLVPQLLQYLGPGTYKDNPGRLEPVGKFSILGQESVAGMDRIALILDRNIDYAIDIKVCRHAMRCQRD